MAALVAPGRWVREPRSLPQTYMTPGAVRSAWESVFVNICAPSLRLESQLVVAGSLQLGMW